MDSQVEYTFFQSHDQRDTLIRRTDDLIQLVPDASMLIFLDKSARPLSSLLRARMKVNQSTDVPPIKFLNIGSEKLDVLFDYARKRGLNIPLNDPDRLVALIQDIETLREIYGNENVEMLQRILHLDGDRNKKRLVVEDTIDSGSTLKLTKRLFEIVDPSHSYEYFIFLESDSDKSPFRSSQDRPAFFPWRRRIGLHNVKDPVDTRSFVTNANINPTARDVRSELIRIASG